MNILQIIGLCLIAPFFICVFIASILQIVEEIKKNPIETIVACIVYVMAIAGFVLLLFGIK